MFVICRNLIPYFTDSKISFCIFSIVAICNCSSIVSAHAADKSIFNCTSHSSCVVAICERSFIVSAYAADIACTTHSSCVVAICERYIIVSAHAADIVCTAHGPCVVAICDRSTIIESAHTADKFITFYIGVDDTHILNGCVLVCLTKQTNKSLCFIVKIQSANRVILSIKCAIVINIFSYFIIASVILIPNREPFSYAFTIFCHGAFIHNNVIHQYRIGGFVSISSIDIFHEPVEIACVCNLIYAFHQFRFFIGITDCAEAVFVKIVLPFFACSFAVIGINHFCIRSTADITIIYNLIAIQHRRRVFPDFLIPNLYSRGFLFLLE